MSLPLRGGHGQQHSECHASGLSTTAVIVMISSTRREGLAISLHVYSISMCKKLRIIGLYG
jgi:hypothetical protein